MAAPLQALLQPDEQVRVKVHAQSVVRYWILWVQLFAVELYLISQGLQLKSWVLGLSTGLYLMLTLRFFFLFLTDHRLVVVRLGMLSTKRWTFEGEIDAAHLNSIAYEDKLLQDRLTIVPQGGKTKRYAVVRGWEGEAKRLAAPQRIDAL